MADTDLHPTGLQRGALAAVVLDFMAEGGLPLRGLAAAADVVAADCRFNHWVATSAKRSGVSEKQLVALLDQYGMVENKCSAAMADFRAGGAVEALWDRFFEAAAWLNKRDL